MDVDCVAGGELVEYACLVSEARYMRVRDDVDTVRLFFVVCNQCAARKACAFSRQRTREWRGVCELHEACVIE